MRALLRHCLPPSREKCRAVVACPVCTVAFWCVLAGLLHAASETLDASFSLHVSLGLATQKPVQVIALATAWKGSAVGQVVTILLLSQWHVHLEHCWWLSVFCVLALPGSACLGGMLAAAMA